MEYIIHKSKNGEAIKGARFNVLLKNHGGFTLIDLDVYADGELDCLGPITLDKVRDHFKTGRLTLTLPAKEKLFIPYIGYVVAQYSTNTPGGGHEKFLESIEITIQKLKSNENVEDVASDCILNFKEWLINPSDENFEKLKHSYLKLPEGRNALFEVDHKDPLIKLMNGGAMPTREQREYYLTDYFDGEWIDLQ
ncbi:hypothetical protein SAMN04488109_5613 [Chryseolinea serpens]|uniref:DUF7638 domain-containing protein n=1 Tax=Chryseolinea serpens TaxID=947013 RepID=A0A1M5WEK3_9BACT|nr:hypothetical protein [Chryseolinea serpens]SHH85654.1 hypothetical protein SAMN04488109_5613 [Chryseolinea serpens]